MKELTVIRDLCDWLLKQKDTDFLVLGNSVDLRVIQKIMDVAGCITRLEKASLPQGKLYLFSNTPKFFMKIVPTDIFSYDRIQVQYEWLCNLTSQRVNVLSLKDIGRVNSTYAYLSFPYIDPNLFNYFNTSDNYTKLCLAYSELGELLKKIHIHSKSLLDPSEFDLFIESIQKMSLENKEVNNIWKEISEELILFKKDEFGKIHGDIYLGNTYKKDTMVLTDFLEWEYNFYMSDIVTILEDIKTNYSKNKDALITFFLKGYYSDNFDVSLFKRKQKFIEGINQIIRDYT